MFIVKSRNGVCVYQACADCFRLFVAVFEEVSGDFIMTSAALSVDIFAVRRESCFVHGVCVSRSNCRCRVSQSLAPDRDESLMSWISSSQQPCPIWDCDTETRHRRAAPFRAALFPGAMAFISQPWIVRLPYIIPPVVIAFALLCCTHHVHRPARNSLATSAVPRRNSISLFPKQILHFCLTKMCSSVIT